MTENAGKPGNVLVHFGIKISSFPVTPIYLDCYRVYSFIVEDAYNRNETPDWVVFESLKFDWLDRKRLGLGNKTSRQGLEGLKKCMERLGLDRLGLVT